jgi:hypothetical protein
MGVDGKFGITFASLLIDQLGRIGQSLSPETRGDCLTMGVNAVKRGELARASHGGFPFTLGQLHLHELAHNVGHATPFLPGKIAQCPVLFRVEQYLCAMHPRRHRSLQSL